MAREAKAMLPSACVWATGDVGHRHSNYENAIANAVRSPILPRSFKDPG